MVPDSAPVEAVERLAKPPPPEILWASKPIARFPEVVMDAEPLMVSPPP